MTKTVASKSKPKKSPKAQPVKKAASRAKVDSKAQPANDARGGILMHVPFEKLLRGPNARDPKSYDEKAMEELVDSIVTQGILQPLRVRPKGDKFEVYVGGRRLSALERLAADGITGQVPVVVNEVSDAEALAEGIAENIQRQAMNALDESEAYLRAVRAGDTPENIALTTGKSLDSVKKRIRLAERLSPAIKTWMRSEDKNKLSLTLEQAQALTVLEPKEQEAFLKGKGNHPGFSAWNVTSLVSDSGFPVKRAVFKRENYKGAIIEDLYGQIEPFFADGKQARRLQLEAAEAQVESLKKKWAWAELHVSKGHSDYFQSWSYDKSKDKNRAGVMVEVTNDFTVKVHEGLVKSETAKKLEKRAEEKKLNPYHITQGPSLKTRDAKVAALQRAVAALPLPGELDPNLRTLLEVVTLGLGNEHDLSIKAHAPQTKDEGLSAQLDTLEDGLEADAVKSFEVLRSLSDKELLYLFKLRVALGISESNNKYSNVNGSEDTENVAALGQHLKVDTKPLRSLITADWLRGFTGGRLAQMYAELRDYGAAEEEHTIDHDKALELGPAYVAMATKKAVIEAILLELPKHPDYVPVELTYREKKHAAPVSGAASEDWEDELEEEELEEDEV